MANVYRSTDSGAPAWPTTTEETPKFVMGVIKACLVTGYGSKSGAGWSVVYEDTTAGAERLALTNGNGVIEFVSWNDRAIGLFIWDSITTPGAGAIYKDDWADVVSVGSNGWKGEAMPAPGSESESMACVYTWYLANSSYQYWDVHADDKSCWLAFEYPSGHASAEPGDTPVRYSYSPVLFFGALRSPDLDRDGPGNFFLGYGGKSIATNSTPSEGNHNSIAYFWGLRTPTDEVPATGNNPKFTLGDWGYEPYHNNHLSAIRPVLPVLINYAGTDVQRSAEIPLAQAAYQFAMLPGVGWFAETTEFWKLYCAEYTTTWLYEPQTIGGKTWRPLVVKSNQGYGITDDAEWWT